MAAGSRLAEEARGSDERASAVGQKLPGGFLGWAETACSLAAWRLEWPARPPRGAKRGWTVRWAGPMRVLKA